MCLGLGITLKFGFRFLVRVRFKDEIRVGIRVRIMFRVSVWSGCAKVSLNLEPKSYLFTHPHVHPPSARAVAPAMPRMHRPLGVPSCFSCLEFLPASPAPPPLEMIY